MLKHFKRRQVSSMIWLIRMILNASRGADEIHDPGYVRLQEMRILSCIHQSSEEEVRNVDWPRHAEAVEYILHDAHDFFSSRFIVFDWTEGLSQNPIPR